MVGYAANPSDDWGIHLEFQLTLNNAKPADRVWFQSKIYVGN